MSSGLRIICTVIAAVALFLPLSGCKSAQPPATQKPAETSGSETYHFPPRPTIPAAHNKTFDKLHLSQKFIDARKPTVWIHVYRGTKCANEKFTTGKYPCGAKYNGAGDYTLGSYTNPLWDDGVLHLADGTESKLWDPDASYTATH